MSYFPKPIAVLLFMFVGVEELQADLDWWQTSVIYQVYSRSFKDSDGDGNGDLKGIEEKLNYFAETGIKTIWLSPIYKSPLLDNGYDVSNYTEIDPLFGTMDDFELLVKKVKAMNINIILDFIPNHTSNESEWFQKSVKRIDPYTDYYVWRDPSGWSDDGKTPIPPNNWLSNFSVSAWEYNEVRKQFYFHQFLVPQVDLNYHSLAVIEEMKNVLRFWLDKGIDGFRVDAPAYLIEDAGYKNEPVISNDTSIPAYDRLDHIYTLSQPETYDILAQFREVLDSYSKRDGHTRLFMLEVYPPNSGNLTIVMDYYGNSTNPISQIPFNTLLLVYLNYKSDANAFQKFINDWLNNMPTGQWPNWIVGNHDRARIPTRFSSQLNDGINMMSLLLPGTALSYYGEEIGMEDNTKIRFDQTQDYSALIQGPELYDSVSRDPERTPFQWDSSCNAGFSNGTSTWLPVNANYNNLNLEVQKNNSRSHYQVYRALLNLRMTEVFQRGNLSTYIVSPWVFAFTRTLSSAETCVVVLNLNDVYENVNLSSAIPHLQSVLETRVVSVNSEYDTGIRLSSGCYGVIDDAEYCGDMIETSKTSCFSNMKQSSTGGCNTGGSTFSMRSQSALVLCSPERNTK